MNKLNKDEEVRELILGAARRVFQKWGLNKTTMEDIAREAGKGKSTLYYYFKSKEDIFEVIALEEMEAMMNKAVAAVSEASTAKEKLKKYIYSIVNEARKTINIYPIIRGEIRGNRNFIDGLLEKMNKKDVFMIMEILKFGINSGELTIIKSTDKLEKTASVISELIDNVVNYLVIENEDNEKLEIALQVITEGL